MSKLFILVGVIVGVILFANFGILESGQQVGNQIEGSVGNTVVVAPHQYLRMYVDHINSSLSSVFGILIFFI